MNKPEKKKSFFGKLIEKLDKKWKKRQKQNLAAKVKIRIKISHVAADSRLVSLFMSWV